MIEHLLKVKAFFKRSNLTQIKIPSQANNARVGYYSSNGNQNAFYKSSYQLIAFLLFGFSSIVSTQNLYGQCDTTIHINGIVDLIPQFCDNDNTDYLISVPVRPPSAMFAGTGIDDASPFDSIALFNPSAAGVGSHTITYTVTSGGGSCPNGTTNSIVMVVSEVPDAGDDGVAFVCNELGASINLFSYLNGSKMTGGTWDTVRGVTPTTVDGTLNSTQITTLGAGVDTFTYTIAGIAPCPDSSASVILTITDPPVTPTLSTIPAICEGESAMITVMGLADATYEIQYEIPDSVNFIKDTITSSGATATFTTLPLTIGGAFTLSAVSNIDVTPSCENSPISVSMPLNVTSSPSIQGRDTALCMSGNFDLRLLVDSLISVGDTMFFTDNMGNHLGNNSMITLTEGTFTYLVTDSVKASDCKDTTQITLTVYRTPNITGSDITICEGTTIDLRDQITGDFVNVFEYGIGDFGNYPFSNGVIMPISTGTGSGVGSVTYYVRDSVDEVAGCLDTAQIVVTIQQSPSIVGKDTTICSGESIDLATLLTRNVAGDSLEFGPANGIFGTYGAQSDSLTGPLTMTTHYFIRDSISNGACLDTTMITVNVSNQPSLVTIDSTICSGDTVNLMGLISRTMPGDTLEFGEIANTYIGGFDPIVFPATTKTYYLRDSVFDGECVATDTIRITVVETPNIEGQVLTVCEGDSVNLSALVTRTVEGDSLEFGTIFGMFGIQSDSIVDPIMMEDTLFFVRDRIAAQGCVDTAVIHINVTPQPSIQGMSTSICPGEPVTLNDLIIGTAVDTFRFDTITGGDYLLSNIQTPIVTTTYIVRDSSATAGCVDTAQITVNVYSPPTADPISGGTTGICVDATATLIPNPMGGATPYMDTIWLSSNSSVATVDTFGVVTGHSVGSSVIRYVIIDANGCQDTSAAMTNNHTVFVYPKPLAGNIIGDTSLCEDATTIVTPSITAGSTPYTFLWSSTDTTIAKIDGAGVITGVSPGETSVQYIVSDNNGCIDTSNYQVVTVDSFPNIGFAISDPDTTVCAGDMVTFTGTGGISYEFLVNNVSVAGPSTTDTYQTSALNDGDMIQVAVTNAAGCQDSSGLIIIKVDTIPDATLISDDSDNIIATGQPVIFTGGGGSQYAFSINNVLVQDTSSIDTFLIDTLRNEDTVMVEVFDGNSCTDTASIIMTVNAPPIAVNDTVVFFEDALLSNILVQENDTDPENDILSTTIQFPAKNGISTVINNDSISYMPNPNFNGLDSIVYFVSDTGPNRSPPAKVYITVLSFNDMPLATNDTLRITEDDPVSIIDVQANDIDVDGDSLITSIVTTPGKGTAVVMMNDSIAYTPMPDSTGVDVIAYQVCDTAGLCGVAIIFIEIDPVNDRPVANQDSIAIPEDSMNVAVAILANDFDADRDIINLDTVHDPLNGGSIVLMNDTLVYTPSLNFTGLDSIQYSICDTALCDTTFLIVNVIPINEPPVAVKDSITVLEDTTNVKIAFLANDMEVDGDSIVLDSLFTSTQGISGTLSNDTLCYTPTANFNGLDSLKYIITDGAFKDSAYIIINVLSVNDAPIAVNDTVTILENSNPAIIAVQANDSDPDGDLFATSLVSGPTNGTAVVAGGNVNYTPPMSFNGIDTIKYQICDTQIPSACDSAYIFITISGVNDAPVAANDTIYLAEDTTAVLIPIKSNDFDIDGDSTMISILTGAAYSLIDSIRADTLVYQPALNFVGLDTIRYQLSDGTLTDQATVYITMLARNDAPITMRDSVTVQEDAANVQIAITLNDFDVDAGDSLIASLVVMPTSGGTASIIDDTMLIYNPGLNFNGIDTIVYQVCDTSSVCTQDTVIATVQSVNDKPIAVDDFFTVNEDTSNVVIDVQANDSDGDGETFITTIISSTMMVDTLNGDSIIVTPPADFTGVQLVGYKICDTSGLCDTAIVTVTVLPINDAPVANIDYVAINQDTTNVGIDPLANDTDIDDPILTLDTFMTSTNGSAIRLGIDSISYTPINGFSGIDTINYVVCDTSMACVDGLVIVTVGFVNTPPVAVNDFIPAINEDSGIVMVNVLTNDTDVNGPNDSLKITNITTPTDGVATIVGDSMVSYTPALNFNGTDSLQYTVCDTSAGCAMAWVYFTVTPVNDKPTAVNDTVALTRDTVGAKIAVELNDTDVDGDATTVDTIGTSTQGVVINVMNDSIIYSANAGFVGVDTIQYELSDGTLKDTALLIVVVTDPNNVVPIANPDMASTVPNVAISIDVQANDVDGNGDNLTTSIVTAPNALNTATIQNGDSILYTPSINFAGFDTLMYQVCDVSLTCDTAMVVVEVVNTLQISSKVFLEGPFDRGTTMMHDSLRKLNLIPTDEPYSTLPNLTGAYEFEHKHGGGNETIANPATVFAVTGPDAIVDWVYLELLTSTDTLPIASRSALIQRDGDIVDVDGTSTVGFEYLPDGNYFLSIRHRNHLGVMTKDTTSFSSVAFNTLDFTQQGAAGTDAFGTHAMDTIETNLVLWAGDGNADRKIIYDGIANDRDPVFFDVITDPLNINSNYNHVAKGYFRGDYDMKGSSVYIGTGNDPDVIFFNVFLHPNNGGGSTIFIIREQIPR